ncbi:hypothetical protein GYH30_024454 [Glycine max]|nr:hypothetical protein GYH30_024454 [Glycine max]
MRKAKKKYLAESRKKAKLEHTIERKDAIKTKTNIIALVETLFVEEHKLTEDARLVALAGKVSEEILEDVVLESLRTLPVKEM